MDTVDRFADLFAGRPNAWGGDEGRAVWQPVTKPLIQGHLDGSQGIGIYPIVHGKDGTLWVKWGCCDIDTGDWSEAYLLYIALKGMGLCPMVERSRSKGWHIWVFAQTWVEAKVMRRALKVAYKAIDLPAKEANPKSEVLQPNQLGNYVRLPYKGWYSDPLNRPTRQVMVTDFDRKSDGAPLSLSGFLEQVECVSPETLQKWAAKWYEPPRATIGISADEVMSDTQIATLAARMPSKLRAVWEHGPKNADRSATLQMIAHQLAQVGFNAQDNYQLVCAADRMWGKYHERTNGETYLLDLVERSYHV
jgi:hypothetical protein